MASVPKQLEVVEFSVFMGREFPKVQSLPGNLVALMSQCRRYASMMERDRNVGDVTEKRIEVVQKRVAAICGQIDPKCVPVFSGDPRGATVKLTVPSGKTNDWGAVGICVPGS